MPPDTGPLSPRRRDDRGIPSAAARRHHRRMDGRARLRVWSATLVALLIGGLLAPASVAAFTDSDHDGLSNAWERTWRLTNPGRWDTDRDGVSDGREDPDHDGLTNAAEQRLHTSPRRADTDHDGWTDGAEYRAGTDPRSAASHPRPKPRPTPSPTPSPTPAPTPAPTPGGAPTLSGAPDCPVFPATNVWNTRIDGRPVASDSATMIRSIGLDRGLHMDFGSYAGYGIPYNIVDATTPRSTVAFDYDDESDHVGYPIPASPQDRRRIGRPHPAGRQGRLPALRAVRCAAVERGVGRRQRGDLGPALECAPAGRLDQRRCRRAADPARTGALRRGRRRCDRPCPALHREPDPPRLRLSRPPLRQLVDRDVVAPDGPAGPAQGVVRHRRPVARRRGSSPRPSSATG